MKQSGSLSHVFDLGDVSVREVEGTFYAIGAQTNQKDPNCAEGGGCSGGAPSDPPSGGGSGCLGTAGTLGSSGGTFGTLGTAGSFGGIV